MTYLNSAGRKGTLLPIFVTAGTFFSCCPNSHFWAVDHMSGYQIRDFLKRKQARAAFPPLSPVRPCSFMGALLAWV